MSGNQQQSQGTDTGSRTMTISPAPQTSEAGPSSSSQPERDAVGVLRLRGGPARRQRVMWSAETIDNEGMGKKKSKICCIYHRPKAFDESSSESSSGSEDNVPDRSGDRHETGHAHRQRPRSAGEIVEESSESDGGGGDGRARPARPKRKQHRHGKDYNHSGPEKSKSTHVNKYDHQPKSSSKS